MQHELVAIGSLVYYDPELRPGVALCSCGAKSHPMYEGCHLPWIEAHAEEEEEKERKRERDLPQ